MHDLVVQQFINKDRAPPNVFALHEALKRGELPPELASVAAEAPGSNSPGPTVQDAWYRLFPEDCEIHGFTTAGDSFIAPDGLSTLTIGSGSCRCMTPKFIQAAAYEAVAGSDIAITDCTPCPVMLENVQVGVYPGKKSAARNTAWAMAALDETPMHCVNWPSFSNIEECRLVLTLRNIRDVSVHVIGKMYVVCEGGCCSF